MKETAKTGRINIGTASIVLILLILCLAVFSLLSLSDAQASLSFARRRAESVQAFYQADAKAQAWADSIRGNERFRRPVSGNRPGRRVCGGVGGQPYRNAHHSPVPGTIPAGRVPAVRRAADLLPHFQQRGLRHRHAAACMDRAGGSRNNGRVICPSSF